ncbi:MAG: CDP-glycerol glycerophosphotransferase family protein [Propionicimonas sp.]|uniref:CDP-glycerol glycerophosphotransferase family protein n=1 Tax=Propionicimonas sp. TaxID=1955623 RepID=UPI002B1F60C4|nr:CDP-glycerol glycerophosphotransferase family protein [Propionicimonas sp.]MEA4945316.1 CDP-glycerol glycerophosphotransferase family protein [Propionicimonas sp.]MEA5116740.1 CDP-glycerol glycerophosphotransferase family protein [Propionicimonas sp.]
MRSGGSGWRTYLALISSVINAYSLVCGLLGLAAVVSALLAPESWVTVALILLGVAAVLASPLTHLVRAGFDPQRTATLIGENVWPRLILLIAALVLTGDSGPRTLVIVLGGLVGILLLAEQSVRRPLTRATPQVANLPGWEVPEPSQALGTWLYGLVTLALLLTGASAMTGLTPVPAAVAVLASFIVTGVVFVQLVRYQRQRQRLEANLPRILADLGPAFAFHWQAPAGTAYQATMWLPYLKRLERPWFVLVRTDANFRELTALTDAPIILRQNLEDLDAVVCPSLKVVFYANTAVRNSHMIRFPHLTHIQLNHGDSDKIASVSPVFRQYDRNFVAGQAAIDRFAIHGVKTQPDQLVIVGRPQLEDVRRARGPVGELTDRVVLYSPTWSGFYEDSDYSSLRAATVIVGALLERGCTVIFRPHPYSRRHRANAEACDQTIALLAADAEATGRKHVFGPQAETAMSLFDCFNASDAMVSDVSSVVSDYLASGKPFAMAAVSAHGEAFAREFPQSAAGYVFDVATGSVPGFDQVLDAMLGADPKQATRDELRVYYLGDSPAGKVADRFIQTARSYLDDTGDAAN